MFEETGKKSGLDALRHCMGDWMARLLLASRKPAENPMRAFETLNERR